MVQMAHLDEGFNVYHLCFLFTLLEVSPPMAWTSSLGRRCLWYPVGNKAPSHWPTHPGPCVEVRTCSVDQGLVEVGLRWGVEVPLCPLLKPLVPHLECLVWGWSVPQRWHRVVKSEFRTWEQLPCPCNYCCIPLPASQGKFEKLSIRCACAGAVSKT